MSDLDELDSPATARALPRSSLGVIIDDGDRAFLYRVLALHARAGIVPVRSLEAVADALCDVPSAETQTSVVQRRSEAARRLAAAFEQPGDVTIDKAIQEAGVRLGPTERACLRLPLGRLADAAFAAELFAGLADLFQAERRR